MIYKFKITLQDNVRAHWLFTFHPGTSFMIIASSSRFSRSIRKVLKQRDNPVNDRF